MVKQSEKGKKRSPLLPVFGLLLAVGLFAIAYFLSSTYVVHIKYVSSIMGPPSVKNSLIFAVAIWLGLLAIVYFVVAILVGRDPDSAKALPPLPRNVKKIRRR